jgi:hypothetical protein
MIRSVKIGGVNKKMLWSVGILLVILVLDIRFVIMPNLK